MSLVCGPEEAAAKVFPIRAIEVQFDDVRARNKGGRHRFRHEEMAGVRRRTDGRMTETVEYALVGKYVAGGDEILNSRLV